MQAHVICKRVCMSVYVHLLRPCGQWFVSVCLLSITLRHCAICNQAGSQEAHIGAHMAGHHAPTQSQAPSHANTCTCLHFTPNCEIVMCASHNLFFFHFFYFFSKKLSRTPRSHLPSFYNSLTICCSDPKLFPFPPCLPRLLSEKVKIA